MKKQDKKNAIPVNSVSQNSEKRKTENPFKTLVMAYNANPQNPDALIALAEAVARSVLKKVIDPQGKNAQKKQSEASAAKKKKKNGSGCNPALLIIRRELNADREKLARQYYAENNSTRLTVDKNGEPERIVIDKTLKRYADKTSAERLGDGLDLVNEAVAAILAEAKKQSEREPKKPLDLERVYTVQRLDKRVYIRAADSAAFKDVETTPIQEVFKAVRRAIANSRAMQTDPRNGYSYLEEIATNKDGEEEIFYRRLPKYSDLGGHVCDFNGKETIPTTADRETVKRMAEIIATLNLTDRQSVILQKTLQGYGQRAIATYLGISHNGVLKHIRLIQNKLIAMGYKPPKKK